MDLTGLDTDFSMHSLKEAIELAMRLSRTDLEAMHKRTKEENPLLMIDLRMS